MPAAAELFEDHLNIDLTVASAGDRHHVVDLRKHERRVDAANAQEFVRRLRGKQLTVRRVVVANGDRDAALADLCALHDVCAAHIARKIILEHELYGAQVRAVAAKISRGVKRARADVERELLGVHGDARKQRAAGERSGFDVVAEILQHFGHHFARARRARFQIVQRRVVDIVRVAPVMIDQNDVLGEPQKFGRDRIRRALRIDDDEHGVLFHQLRRM